MILTSEYCLHKNFVCDLYKDFCSVRRFASLINLPQRGTFSSSFVSQGRGHSTGGGLSDMAATVQRLEGYSREGI